MPTNTVSEENLNSETTNDEVEKLRKQVKELKQLLNRIEENSWKEAYSPSNIKSIVEERLISSATYRLGRWVVFTFITLGAIVWFGGSIYAGIQIQSIQMRAEKSISELNTRSASAVKELEDSAKNVKTKISDLDKEISDLSSRLEAIEKAKLSEVNKTKTEIIAGMVDAKEVTASKARTVQIEFDGLKSKVVNQAGKAIENINSLKGDKQTEVKTAASKAINNILDLESEVTAKARTTVSVFDDKKDTLLDEAREAKENIIRLKDNSVIAIKQTSEKSLNAISEETEIAKALLNVNSLPDLRALKNQIAALEKSAGKLNVKNIYKLAHWSWWVLVITTVLLAIIGIFSFLVGKKTNP
jgi:uncharacterized membrane protein